MNNGHPDGPLCAFAPLPNLPVNLIGLADCNNFFCSCERVFRPDLRSRPVVVLSNNDGCVVARSNESKALGIKMGDVYYQVRDVLEREGVAVFSSNYTLYGDMSRRVMSLLSKYAPRIDIYSIDEAFLDFTGMGTPEEILEYARRMARHVSQGTGIPISVGIAATKTLAKIASKFAKKYPAYQSVCMIDTDEKRLKALQLFDIADVWGVGRRYVKRLNAAGVNTAYDFTLKPSDWVMRNFTVVGLRTWKELRGESCISTEELPRKKSICTSRSFPDSGINRLGDLEEAVANFASQCARKLREQRTACQALTVFAYTSRFRPDLPQDYIYANCHLPTATACLTEIVGAAVEAIRRNWKSEAYRYKKAGVIAWNICRDDSIQLSLFDPRDREKMFNLQRAIDVVNLRNGHNAVRAAVQGYSKTWHLKTEHLSRQFTTNMGQIIEITT